MPLFTCLLQKINNFQLPVSDTGTITQVSAYNKINNMDYPTHRRDNPVYSIVLILKCLLNFNLHCAIFFSGPVNLFGHSPGKSMTG